MKILIIGEFSGFAKHLKNGFLQLGHDVTLVQSGDAWKKLASKEDILCRDKSWYFEGHHIPGSNRFMALFTNIRVKFQIWRRCSHPDVIVVINYSFLRKNITYAGISTGYLNRCLSSGSKLIMSECGDGSAQAYSEAEYYKMIGRTTSINDRRYQFLLKNSTVIIPTIFGYYNGLLRYSEYFSFNTKKVTKPIPLPITVEECTIKPCVNRKIVIFHGIIRPVAKGTPFIQAAMNRIQREMPDRVECICKGGMPYKEYVKIFDSIDILIDQTYGNGWGMNAVIGAMKGKCVLAPCGPENALCMNIPMIPFIQITPDSEQIYQVLKDLINQPEKVDSLKKASHRFVKEFCNSKLIAQRYIDSVS